MDEALVRIAGATTIVNAANGLSVNDAIAIVKLSSASGRGGNRVAPRAKNTYLTLLITNGEIGPCQSPAGDVTRLHGNSS
jgi:hypothetical protein